MCISIPLTWDAGMAMIDQMNMGVLVLILEKREIGLK
jgi:hypothetical protein